MTNLTEIVIGLLALVSMGGMTWVLKAQRDEARRDTQVEKEENRRLQEQHQQVVNDAQERKSEEAVQRDAGDAASRLRESKWMRDEN